VARPLDAAPPGLSVTARHLRPEVDEAEATRRNRGENGGLLAHIVHAFAPVAAPHKIELVWAPVYLVTIAVDHRGQASRTVCSVDALSGAFAIFDAHAAVEPGVPDGETFAPLLSTDDAERIARESLVLTILRRRGRAGKPVPRETESVELLRWPYWVFYHRRRGGVIDIRVWDGVTGGRAGHKIMLGLMEAFRAAARAQTTD